MMFLSLFVSLQLFGLINGLHIPVLYERAASAAAICTNYNLTYKLTSITAPVLGKGTPPSGQQVFNMSIDDKSTGYKQNITGFGAAVTDATVVSFNSLSSSNLDQLLTTLMTSSGANFSLMRHTIGGSDLSPDPPYTYDENGGQGQPDQGLANFSLGTNGTAMANLIAKMKAKSANLNVVGSPWSPPSWMKENKRLIGNTANNNLSDRYLNNTEPNYADAYAQYFIKYIKAFTNLGAPINAITLQNEPLYSDAGYPTMYMFDQEQGLLIQNFVGPQMASAGITNTSIWAYDHNTDVPSYPTNVLSIASKYTSTVAWHCYAGNLNWTALTTFHQANPTVQQYMTECWTPYATGINFFQAANFTIGPLQNWASGVMAWTLGTDANNGPHLSTGGCANCPGLVKVNGDGSYSFTIAYYLMAQFSRYMPRGSIVLQGNGSSATSNAPGVQFVSSLNPVDGSRTAVFMNTVASDVFVRLNTTSGQVWSGSVPMQSVVTWTLPKAG